MVDSSLILLTAAVSCMMGNWHDTEPQWEWLCPGSSEQLQIFSNRSPHKCLLMDCVPRLVHLPVAVTVLSGPWWPSRSFSCLCFVISSKRTCFPGGGAKEYLLSTLVWSIENGLLKNNQRMSCLILVFIWKFLIFIKGLKKKVPLKFNTGAPSLDRSVQRYLTWSFKNNKNHELLSSRVHDSPYAPQPLWLSCLLPYNACVWSCVSMLSF